MLSGAFSSGYKAVARRVGKKPYHVRNDQRADNTSNNGTCTIGIDPPDLSAMISAEIWKESISPTHNYIHDSCAYHYGGVLGEAVSGLDKGLPNSDNLNNWYIAFSKAVRESFIADKGSEYISDSRANAEKYVLGMKGNKNSVSTVQTGLLIEVIKQLYPRFNENLSSKLMLSAVTHSTRQLGNDVLKLIKTGTVDFDESSDKEVSFDMSDDEFNALKSFYYHLLENVTSKDFRTEIVADVHSFVLLQQVVGFLSTTVSFRGERKAIYEHFGIHNDVYSTMREYYVRVASEHLFYKKELVAERFVEIHSKAPVLDESYASYLKALENKQYITFLKMLKNETKKNGKKNYSSDALGMKEYLNDLLKYHESVLSQLQSIVNKTEVNPNLT